MVAPPVVLGFHSLTRLSMAAAFRPQRPHIAIYNSSSTLVVICLKHFFQFV